MGELCGGEVYSSWFMAGRGRLRSKIDDEDEDDNEDDF
jgi:hypothetical protein